MLNIAIVGRGKVASEIVNILEERSFPLEKLFILDEKINFDINQQEKIEYKEQEIIPQILEDFDFTNVDLAFFCAGTEVSKKYAEKVALLGVKIIDSSSFFRSDPLVPLIIPEINADLLPEYKNKNIVVSPNCTTTIMLMAIYPLFINYGIKKIIISTYQSTSGAGSLAMDELFNQSKAIYSGQPIVDLKNIFTKQIAFNVIPCIGEFQENDFTTEEEFLKIETNRILNQDLEIIATCVRVPTFVSHAMSLHIECEQEVDDKEEIKDLLRKYVSVIDYKHKEGYVTPFESIGEDAVFVSRIRKSSLKSIDLWVVGDNLRKGSALNMVQIAELICFKY